MIFKRGFVYHVYNQGNNRRIIFFSDRNYLFFHKKIKQYILPYSDILAWCLMPNHFHLMIFINEVSLVVPSHEETSSHHLAKKRKDRTLNDSIAILLRSYTRAINKQQNYSGSLFRKETKAECLSSPGGISPAWVIKQGITEIPISITEKQYPQNCFNYIHKNPVKAKLVSNPEDWLYSSAKYYSGKGKDELVNKERASEFIKVKR